MRMVSNTPARGPVDIMCHAERMEHSAQEKWTAPIHQILKAIDNHTRLYIETGDVWHEEQAQILRKYIKDVKVWIHKEENWEL
jgi:hypothetical protein